MFEATARLLATRGAKVVLGARREERLKKVAADIRNNGGEAVSQAMDVVDPADNSQIVDLANREFGRVDVIFLNAGLMPSSPISALKTDEWDRMIDVNIKGVLNGVAAVMPTFLSRKSGHVIAVSSVADLKAYPNSAVYGGTKWFVRDFMEVLRMESAMEGTNIRTATVYPAAINTELLSTISDENAAKGMTALYARYGISADRIASAIAFAIEQPEDTNVNEFTWGGGPRRNPGESEHRSRHIATTQISSQCPPTTLAFRDCAGSARICEPHAIRRVRCGFRPPLPPRSSATSGSPWTGIAPRSHVLPVISRPGAPA